MPRAIIVQSNRKEFLNKIERNFKNFNSVLAVELIKGTRIKKMKGSALLSRVVAQGPRTLVKASHISCSSSLAVVPRLSQSIARNQARFVSHVSRKNRDFFGMNHASRFSPITRLQSIQTVQKRSLFIQTEETPNPASLKFIPGETVLDPADDYGSSMSFKKNDNLNNSPLAKRLFRIPGIETIMFGEDFVSINKNESVAWSQLKPEIFACLMDFFNSGRSAVNGPKIDDTISQNEGNFSEEDDEIVMLVKELLEERIRPMVQEDGGDIFFHSYDGATGIVVVRLAGSCEGCPSSTVTLKNGVENMLMHYIPEISRVDQFIEEEELNQRTLTWTPSP